jgi:hypothetical protein
LRRSTNKGNCRLLSPMSPCCWWRPPSPQSSRRELF